MGTVNVVSKWPLLKSGMPDSQRDSENLVNSYIMTISFFVSAT